jgi:hypothetical protein
MLHPFQHPSGSVLIEDRQETEIMKVNIAKKAACKLMHQLAGCFSYAMTISS